MFKKLKKKLTLNDFNRSPNTQDCGGPSTDILKKILAQTHQDWTHSTSNCGWVQPSYIYVSLPCAIPRFLINK